MSKVSHGADLVALADAHVVESKCPAGARGARRRRGCEVRA